MNFNEKLSNAVHKNKSLLCVGLDPDPALMLHGLNVSFFVSEIIEATSDLVCAYKFNMAFFEALGAEGCDVLNETLDYVPEDVVIIGDGKRGDIGNTSKAYAKAIFEVLGCDAATVNPYLGFDSLEPFISYTDKGIFVLCRTSNPGAVDFQSLRCETDSGTRPLFEVVARKAREWNKEGNVGLVVGATYPQELKVIRETCPDMPILIPGVGAQGGDLCLAVRHGVDSHGEKAIINSSRQIIYASKSKDFAQAARHAAQAMRDQINGCLAKA